MRAALGCIVIAGFLLRLFRLDHQPLWLDEALSLRYAARPFAEQWLDQLPYANPPLYFSGLRVWTRLFGASEAALRLPSVLFGAVLIPLIYAFGARSSRRAGLAAALLAAFSPFGIYYSQEARMYALSCLLGLLSCLLLVRALDGRSLLRWTLYAAVSAAGLYTHNYGLFIPAGQAAFVAWRRRDAWRPFAASQAALVLLFAPRLYLFSLQLGMSMNPWIPVPGFFDFVRSFAYFHALSAPMPETPAVGWAVLLSAPAAALAILLGFRGESWRKLDPDAALPLAVLAACTVLPFLLSVTVVPLYFPGRYQIVGLPFFLILVAMGVSKVASPALRNGLLAWLVLAGLPSLHASYFLFEKGNAPSIAETLRRRAGPGDAFLFTNLSAPAVAYYLGDCRRCVSFPEEVPGGYVPREGLEGDPAFAEREVAAAIEGIEDRLSPGGSVWAVLGREPEELNARLLQALRARFREAGETELLPGPAGSFRAERILRFESGSNEALEQG